MKQPAILLIKSRSLVSKIRGTTPPLGILLMASYLRKKLNVEVKIMDAWLELDPLKAAADIIKERRPDIVGIRAITAEAFLAHKIADAIKSVNSDLPVIMGGPYPSSDPESVLGDKNIDVAVIGEGEETFLELVKIILKEKGNWKNADTLKNVDGIAFPSEFAVRATKPRKPIDDLDFLPFPAWDLIDYKKFWNSGGMATMGTRPYLTMFTSRGCPYHCVYCHQLFGKRFRARSPENIADEVAWILNKGVKHIEILDDISNLDHERFNRILKLLLKKNLHPVLSFPNGIRADIMNEDSVDLLKSVGTGEISIAVETVSNRLQKLLDKNLDLEKTSVVIEMFAKRKIFTRGFFMLGLPTETEKEMRDTIRFAHKSNLHLALFFTPNPFKNTKLYDMFVKAGKMPKKYRTIDFEYFGSPFNGSHMPDKTYRRLYKWAYAGFYLNPVRMFRILCDRPIKSDIPARAFGLFRNFVSFRRLTERQ